MKRIFLLIITLVIVLSVLSFTKDAPIDKGFAVVELFTSQGCSSCPAADKLLDEMTSNDKVFALSFHVSYWNYLGWKDPYSSEQFTKRQRTYGEKLNLKTIYTPQMIVNGQTEFVGSSQSSASSAVTNALKQTSENDIDIISTSNTNSILTLKYAISGALDNTLLNIAIVERHVENYVPRGENSHKTLKHDNVVRSFTTIVAKDNGSVHIELPDTFNKDKSSIILYLQNKESYKITGASQKAL